MQKGAAANPGVNPVADPRFGAVEPGLTPGVETGEPRGLEFTRYFSRDGLDPFDEIEWEREGGGSLRAARGRDSPLLVAAGDQHRRLEVLPWADRHARP
jgi:hypothetical protein